MESNKQGADDNMVTVGLVVIMIGVLIVALGTNKK